MGKMLRVSVECKKKEEKNCTQMKVPLSASFFILFRSSQLYSRKKKKRHSNDSLDPEAEGCDSNPISTIYLPVSKILSLSLLLFFHL